MGDSGENQTDVEKATAAELEAAGQSAMFGDPTPPAQPAPTPEITDAAETLAQQSIESGPAAESPPPENSGMPYRVLARKYRPQSFAQLIGQDAMIQTLGNAIKRDRLAHAFLMTGVRGVGKTSTARLIAKSLNCVGEDGQGGATIDPCGKCEPCQAITEGRHIDVIEMDAASHTGVDDVREIIEAVRYAAVSARYKIYIIDEVHMLSKNAFNALLKTLEEPPPHVKFLFATTEVNKIPITVLSRCQRFDLKRIPVELLAEHFGQIAVKERVEAEENALRLIAQAAEGSVRDGLSILDQAIAHADMARSTADEQGAAGKDNGTATIGAAQLRDMLGLSDRGAVRRLFAIILSGDAQAMLADVARQFALGVEPHAILSGLLTEIHRLTLSKIGAPHDPALPAEARDEVDGHADELSFPKLHRLWQLMLKGHEEVSRAANPREACDMALLRVIHGAAMPDPGELARAINEGGVAPDISSGEPASSNAPSDAPPNPPISNAANDAPVSPPRAASAAKAEEEPSHVILPASFGELLDQLGQHNFINLEMIMRDVMRVAEYSPPLLAYQFAGPVPSGFLKDLAAALKSTTGQHWQLEERAGEAAPSLYEIEQEKAEAEKKAIMESPMVKAAFSAFPDAEILPPEKNEDESRSAQA